MSRSFATLLLTSLVVLGTACPGPAETSAGADAQVQKAAQLAKDIAADPDAAEATLEAAGMSVEEFEALMIDIAADPTKSAAFEAAQAG